MMQGIVCQPQLMTNSFPLETTLKGEGCQRRSRPQFSVETVTMILLGLWFLLPNLSISKDIVYRLTLDIFFIEVDLVE